MLIVKGVQGACEERANCEGCARGMRVVCEEGVRDVRRTCIGRARTIHILNAPRWWWLSGRGREMKARYTSANTGGGGEECERRVLAYVSVSTVVAVCILL